MLPDFPQARSHVHTHLQRYIRQVAHQQGLMQGVKAYNMPEGNRCRLTRADGSVQRVRMKRIRGRMVVPKNDVSVKTVIDACTKVAAQMGTAESQHVLDVVDRICEETGQVHNSKGEPFTFQSVLKGLEMMDLDFDERGNPQMPRFVAGAVAYEKFRTLELSDADEIAWQELVERKRADWRFRESNRKLAG